ncbi:MAG: ABC transporter permease [Terracidiphilus sp.]
MRWFDQLRMRILMLIGRKRAATRLDDELSFHLEHQIAENIAAGMSPDEARHAALRTFGNPALLREQSRATWSWNGLESLARDLRYSARTLRRTPTFSLMAILVIALCIGAATSLFTIVRSVLLKPLPFRDPGRLVMVFEHFRGAWANQDGFNYNFVSPADYYDWRAQTHGFQDMAAWRWWQFNLTGEQDELPEVVDAAAGTWNLFPLLGVQPAFGRTFTESEDHPDSNVVMLTWSTFERRFSGDRAIVGRQIHLDGKPFTVIGILPKDFAYPYATVQVWVPYQAVATPESLRHHDWHQSHVIARLRPEISLANAVSQVGAVQYREHLQYLNAPVAEDVAPRAMIDDLAKDVKKPLLLLMSAVACVLFIGCLNVANLLVARGAARQKEVAIRGALGAQRWTLVREQLTESLMICFAGGVAGVLLSLTATKWLAHAWKDLPSAQGIHVDGVVLGFACAMVFAAALLAGLLPAVTSTGKAVFATLQASSRTTGGSLSRTALRKTLLTVEIGVTVVLLIGAGLLLKSFVRLRTTDLGCATDNVLTMSYTLPDQKYDKPEKINAFSEGLLARLRTMPRIRAVALGSTLPGNSWGGDDVFTIPEHPPIKPGAELPDALNRVADPGYFTALEIPLLQGRFFTNQDRDDHANQVIISHQLAKQYFPGENPLGRHLLVSARDKAPYEIVGVVGDTLWQVGQPTKATMYFPLFSGNFENSFGFSLAVRTDSDPLAMSIPIQKQFAALDPELPVSDVLTLDQVIGESIGNASFSATLVLSFAVLSLLLASVGLYGVLSYLVTQRMTEIGIRIALGAQREQVLRLALVDGLRPACFGLVFGLAASVAAVRLIRSMLYKTEPFDPAVFAAVAATLLTVAAIACLVPAWRASRLDPIQALRTE